MDIRYSPPWANTSIIGIAGSSGSGKTSIALEVVRALNLPWVVILSMDSFYNVLTPEQHEAAFRNEFDFDSPKAIDWDVLVDVLTSLKQGKKADIPVYSFEKHAREERTTTIYSPHVLVLEGIFALYEPRILELLDLRMFAEADADLCLSRRITRDIRERGRDIEGCIKQWFKFVKPNYERYVRPQRAAADIIIPRGIENKVALDMVVKHVQRSLLEKSMKHQEELRALGKQVADEPLADNAHLLKATPQIAAMDTILQNPTTSAVDFNFYFDRLAALLIERGMDNLDFQSKVIKTPLGLNYHGLIASGPVCAVIVLRGGSCFEAGLRRVVPDCQSGRILIQTNYRTGEPELHFQRLPNDIGKHHNVLVLDPQMASGGAALMAVKVLIDHGVQEHRIVFVTYLAGRTGVNRLAKVFPKMKIIICRIVGDDEDRWVESRYFRC